MLGEIIMKNYNFVICNCLIAFITLLSSSVVLAEKSYQQKYRDALGKQMQVKCYVEYQGGGDDIRYMSGGFKKPSHAIKTLQGKKVSKHNQKSQKVQKTIYKVNECVQEHELFTNNKARHLNKVTPR
jgi:hypothetical protein